MSINNFLLFAGDKVNLVKVFFGNQSTNHYTYMSTEHFEPGEFAVVNSPRDGLVVVTVVECIPADQCDLHFKFELKWIISKVDTTAYEQRKEMLKAFNEQINSLKAKKLRKELQDAAVAELGEDGVQQIKALVRL